MKIVKDTFKNKELAQELIEAKKTTKTKTHHKSKHHHSKPKKEKKIHIASKAPKNDTEKAVLKPNATAVV